MEGALVRGGRGGLCGRQIPRRAPQRCATIITINFRTFDHPQEKLHTCPLIVISHYDVTSSPG